MEKETAREGEKEREREMMMERWRNELNSVTVNPLKANKRQDLSIYPMRLECIIRFGLLVTYRPFSFSFFFRLIALLFNSKSVPVLNSSRTMFRLPINLWQPLGSLRELVERDVEPMISLEPHEIVLCSIQSRSSDLNSVQLVLHRFNSHFYSINIEFV